MDVQDLVLFQQIKQQVLPVPPVREQMCESAEPGVLLELWTAGASSFPFWEYISRLAVVHKH